MYKLSIITPREKLRDVVCAVTSCIDWRGNSDRVITADYVEGIISNHAYAPTYANVLLYISCNNFNKNHFFGWDVGNQRLINTALRTTNYIDLRTKDETAY